jgi:ribosomal protein S18 acetylase RimI-like enzyme
MGVSVRPALTADLDSLVEMNRVVQGLHAELYPTDFKAVVDPSAVKAFLASRLAAHDPIVALAEADQMPAGYMLAQLQPRPETPFNPSRPRIYIHHVAVAPVARRRGVGTALFQYVQQQAADLGIATVALDVWAANLPAQQFFASLGFTAFNLSLRKTSRSHDGQAEFHPDPG